LRREASRYEIFIVSDGSNSPLYWNPIFPYAEVMGSGLGSILGKEVTGILWYDTQGVTKSTE